MNDVAVKISDEKYERQTDSLDLKIAVSTWKEYHNVDEDFSEVRQMTIQ